MSITNFEELISKLSAQLDQITQLEGRVARLELAEARRGYLKIEPNYFGSKGERGNEEV